MREMKKKNLKGGLVNFPGTLRRGGLGGKEDAPRGKAGDWGNHKN